MLDNCEHLIASCAELGLDVASRSPRLRILATSREVLNVQGETICRVPSLSLPDLPVSVSLEALIEHEATRLFVERASAVDPALMPTLDNANAIASICRRLDGIPLAIELAAARIVVLSPHQIEARFQDRFRLLTGGARTAVVGSGHSRQRWTGVTGCCQMTNGSREPAFSVPGLVDARAAEFVCGGTASTAVTCWICCRGGREVAGGGRW